jgi:hypothetical protein
MPKKVTLSMNPVIWDNFHDYCAENDIMISKRIERLIGKHLEEVNK